LSFSDPIHRFNPAQRSSRTVERLEPHHWFDNPFNVSVTLFNDVVGVSVVMEPDFALRVFQKQTDNFYGYQFKPGQ